MRRIGIIVSVLAVSAGTVFSQSLIDGYKYSQSDLTGTARYISMAGAFGALGGDVSALTTNPAGLGIYRSSEVVTTLSVSTVGAKADWVGSNVDERRTTFNFDNIAYVGYFPTGNDEGIVSWNAAFSYNRVKNYSRDYTMGAGSGLHTSLSDYTAERAAGYSASDLSNSSAYYDSDIDWLSLLSYQGGYMLSAKSNTYTSAFMDESGDWLSLEGAQLRVIERGSIDKYNLGLGANISDVFYMGASVSITDLDYTYESMYDETFSENSSLYLDNYLETSGTGYSFNVGIIIRPVDYFRFGVAYNSSTWYEMTDYYQGTAYSNIPTYTQSSYTASTPNGAYYEYDFRSPDKWLVSAAVIIGTDALISVDYELTNYNNMRFEETDGSSMVDTNQDISDNFKIGHTVRVGGEVRMTPQFSLRAGVSYTSSPMESWLKEGSEVATAGTIPHYAVDDGPIMNYAVGFGYRFWRNFFADLACVFRTYKEDVYAFSNIEDEIEAQPASMRTNTTRIALTIGYKF